MSIYPVRLSEWYPPGDELHDTVAFIVSSFRCKACYSRCRWKAAVAHHSIGHGYGDVWCSWKCCLSGNDRGPDKRQKRKIHRDAGKIRELWDKVLKNT